MLGFLLASFGFVEFFYILLERSEEIQHHMVFLLSPIIRSMTVVNIGSFLILCLFVPIGNDQTKAHFMHTTEI